MDLSSAGQDTLAANDSHCKGLIQKGLPGSGNGTVPAGAGWAALDIPRSLSHAASRLHGRSPGEGTCACAPGLAALGSMAFYLHQAHEGFPYVRVSVKFKFIWGLANAECSSYLCFLFKKKKKYVCI